MGLVFSIFCFVHLWVPRRLNIKPKLSPPWQTGLQAQARGHAAQYCLLGIRRRRAWTFGVVILGTWASWKHLPSSAATSAGRPLGDSSPSQPGGGGRIGKTPVIFRKEHRLLSTRQRGWRAREGPSRAVSPSWLQPSRN